MAVARSKGVSITAVTKAFGGRPDIGRALLGAGVRSLGDSRVENLERLRTDSIASPMMLIRSPMQSQVDRIVRNADLSLNTEVETIAMLSKSAEQIDVVHGVVLMVELGDLREGFLPEELDDAVTQVLQLPNIQLAGIGTNLACRSGVVPDARNMRDLSVIADRLESVHSIEIKIVSGGNSANLNWLLSDAPVGRINELRLGEAILLGCEPLYRRPIEGLCGDAFFVVGEVIESRKKPTEPWGEIAQPAFPQSQEVEVDTSAWQTIIALGRQDTDPEGLLMPQGFLFRGASSDHLVLGTNERVRPGTAIKFLPNYSALTRSMSSSSMQQVRCS